jgi:hypothetical protein
MNIDQEITDTKAKIAELEIRANEATNVTLEITIRQDIVETKKILGTLYQMKHTQLNEQPQAGKSSYYI